MPVGGAAGRGHKTHRPKNFGERSIHDAHRALPHMVQRCTLSSSPPCRVYRPIHSKPPIAYFLMSASYLRKRARFAAGTSVDLLVSAHIVR
jgi:hypothetical protein